MSLALIFPGQGAQEPGMGRGLLDAGAPAAAIAIEASEILGWDLVAMACDADAEAIRATEIAQPLLLVHSVALMWSRPREPAALVGGHSLGEYSALVAAGSLRWQDALRLVQERGLAMAEAAASAGGSQGMSAVLGLDGTAVTAALEKVDDALGVVTVANFNAPGQVVLSGHLAALQAAAEVLKASGARRVIGLPVGGAFHSPLMGAAAGRLATAIDAAPFQEGNPQVFNVDAAVHTSPDEVRAALKAQLMAPVRWVECIEVMARAGCDRFVEFGPSGTLCAMGRRISASATWESVAAPSSPGGVQV
ncbi:MAG: ACP S-malonyltransferase [Candidatus Dormibacteria bacterium]